MGETSLAMTYGAEAMIPLEANFPTLRKNSFTPSDNDELLGESLDLIEERRERATIHLAYYHQKLKQGYDVNVKLRPLAPGDLVLRKVVGVAKDRSWGKLGPILGKAQTQLGRAILDYFGSRNKCILFRRLR